MIHTRTMICGYFGKLPVRGDFIQRNLTPEFVSLWDTWLQRVMKSSHTTLGEQWINHYLVSPIWRFFLTLDNGKQFAGILLPSVDKVGRYFPFTIAIMLKKNIGLVDFLKTLTPWYQNAEALALQALDEQMTFEQLNQAIDNLQLINNNDESQEPEKNSHSYRVALTDNTKLDLAISLIQARMATPTTNMTSYWWNEDVDHMTGNVICCPGLPDDDIFVAMLDGQWDLSYIKTLELS